MTTCAISPVDKRAYGKAVGDELLRLHGKKRYYSVRQTRSASDGLGFPVDWSCWAMSLYTSPGEFARHHAALGETCDYAGMKAEMFSAMTDGASRSWFSFDMSWLEWPDIDFSSIFDFFDV
jgi:hypothetical protein